MPCLVVSDTQPLPDMNEFYSRLDNKISLQNFFVNYCITNFTSSKPLYIRGGLAYDPERCSLIANCHVEEATSYRVSHEEADDQTMFSIQQIYLKSLQNGTITVVSPDADIFVVLLYHLKNNWQGLSP